MSLDSRSFIPRGFKGLHGYPVSKERQAAAKPLAATLLLLSLFASLAALSPYNALGDTLTVIQQPLLNIPAIHIPGETLTITCVAPPSTTGWQAWLVHKHKSVALEIIHSQFLNTPDRWELQALIPSLPVYELYDLRVTASGGIDDTTTNAVKVIPTRKSSYYFIHITDLHLPTRIYYPNSGFDSDSTSVNDFRAVIDDINLINPEFVLLTGDLLNEGELEGFAGQHWYGWTQRLLEEFEVPCYVTAGNHDLGGWNSTPPPQGSSRRNWWRYFGWPWLDNPDSNWLLHTQDYDFIYGDIHFIGLESYDNYDNWRPNIYGGQSFIYDQIYWLNQRLSLHPDKTRVLFYHYDFSDQLNLSALGVDLALWGHIHYNSGSVSAYPCNLGTRSVCDGNRSYRVIRVNGTQLQPLKTIYAGSNSQALNVIWFPSNTAVADSVAAMFNNNQSVAFEHSLLKFRMPPGSCSYSVTNGTLLQVDRSDRENICYVHVDLPAMQSRVVSVSAQSGTASEDPLQPEIPLILDTWPNPFAASLNINLDTRFAQPRVRIYNLRGARIRDLVVSTDGANCVWDGNLESGQPAPAGIYLLRAETGKNSELRRVVKTR